MEIFIYEKPFYYRLPYCTRKREWFSNKKLHCLYKDAGRFFQLVHRYYYSNRDRYYPCISYQCPTTVPNQMISIAEGILLCNRHEQADN